MADKHNSCMLKHACGKDSRSLFCRFCRVDRCSDFCKARQFQQCVRLEKTPCVCNSFGKRTGCGMDKKIYSSKYADDSFRKVIVSSREEIHFLAF